MFGDTLYFVHDTLLTIVEGKPIISYRSDIPYQDQQKRSKFGLFYGQYVQFGLFDDSKEIPNLKVCVNWDCNNCFQSKLEAVIKLNSLIKNNISCLKRLVIGRESEIADLFSEITEFEKNIKSLQNKLINEQTN